MKTNQLIAFLFSIFIAQALSAQLSHPHFISLNVGSNIPLSEYEKADSLVSVASANSGLYYSFEAGAYFSKVMGVGLNIGSFSNSVDEQSIIEQLEADFTNSAGNFEVSSNNWSNGYMMIGPYFSFGKEAFIVDAKILAGVINSEKPFINIESNDPNIDNISISEVSNTALGLNYGLHFRIKLTGKLALRVNGEGLLTKHEFLNKVRQTNSNGDVTVMRETVEQEISVLNLGLGVVINL